MLAQLFAATRIIWPAFGHALAVEEQHETARHNHLVAHPHGVDP
jgi:hypothetical protein